MENNSTTDVLQYQLALTLLPGVGDITAKNLISYCGGAEAIFKEKQQALLKIPKIGQIVTDKIKNGKVQSLKRAEEEIRFIEKNKIKA
ncbi:MAG TPA: DNA-protecting protein DprA, partial [Bacteroidia bacterium]|nr:DNA-protecting protein DprA [Bacteroidia bacterium]